MCLSFVSGDSKIGSIPIQGNNKTTERRNYVRLKSENMMQCNRCGHIFSINDAAICYRSYGGAQIREKKCPICNSSFSAFELSQDLDKYLFVNNDERYYIYKDKGEN